MPRAAAFDLPRHERVPARFDAGKLAQRRALYLGNGGADLAEDALLLIFRQLGPRLAAHDARQARDDEIRPAVALAFGDDLGNWHRQPSTKLRQ
jgi:hypothetical protein